MAAIPAGDRGAAAARDDRAAPRAEVDLDPLAESKDGARARDAAEDDSAERGYYWEEGEEPGLGTAVAHNLHWLGSSIFYGMETVGEAFAAFLGLHNSRYQYEIDLAEREKAEIARQILIRRQREMLRRRAEQLEARRQAGLAAADDDEAGGVATGLVDEDEDVARLEEGARAADTAPAAAGAAAVRPEA